MRAFIYNPLKFDMGLWNLDRDVNIPVIKSRSL